MDRLDRSTNLLKDVTRGLPSHSKLLRLDDSISNTSMTINQRDMSIMNSSLMHKRSRKFKKSDLKDLSLSIAYLEDSEINSLLEQSVTTRIIDEDVTNVYELFQEVLELHGDSQSVFDAIQNFIEIINKTISVLSSSNDTLYNADSEKARLVNERNTWLLIHALYKDREISKGVEDFDSELYGNPMSEKELISHLYKQDARVRECQMVVDWLERVSREEAGDYAKVPHFTDPTVCWENTQHQIHNSTLPAFASTRQLVTSLDPDAPGRENKHLHDIDQDDQYRLFTELFKEIRMGRLDNAQSLCLHCGNAWLASILEGWRLYHDPNMEPAMRSSSTVSEAEGNPERGVWKFIAWSICEGDDATDIHDALERAIYGSFCGHVDSLKPFCTSWEDQLWAYTKTSIDIRVEKEIRDNSLKTYEQLPEKYWNSYFSLEEIFNRLKATPELKMEANSISRVIQELVCLNKSSDMVQVMSAYLENMDVRGDDAVDGESKDLVRFMAHIVLVLRMIGVNTPTHHANHIIKTYVKLLCKEGNGNLVAFYSSKLEPEDQIEEYSLFLSHIEDVNRKIQCLRFAKQYNLDIESITHRTANIIWAKCDKETQEERFSNEELNKDTSEVDLIRIEALDWLVFFVEQRSQALIETNTIIRNFISQGKIDAASKAYYKMPEDSLDLIMSQYKCTMNKAGYIEPDHLPPSINSAISEYLAYKAYLDAQEGFSNWFKMFHSKPSMVKIDNMDDLSDFTKRVSLRETQRQMNEKYQSWKATIDHVTRTVKAQLYNVLVFPPRGWLVDIFANTDSTRKTQLDSLRSLCISQIILLLHTLLDQMELYEDCLDLCTVITSEEHHIYKVLSKQELKDILEKISSSCLKLACVAPDAFGLAPPIEPKRPLKITL